MTLLELHQPLAENELWAQPLADFLNERVERLGLDAVIAEFGLHGESGARRLYRFRNCLVSSSRDNVKGDYPTDRYSRRVIVSLFAEAEVGAWEVYPELAEVATAVERFCGKCHEVVTVAEDGACPWCESETTSERPPDRKWCPGCDRMVWPTKHGRCWRCETRVQAMPWDDCKCGCDERVHRFDRHGRRIQYVRGHAPRTQERSEPIPAEPFAAWLVEEIRNLDPIAAIVSRTNLTREEIIGLIEGNIAEFDRERIRRALWLVARAGSGTGAQPNRNVPGFFDLSPDAKRAMDCPGCGGGNAPHAELCKRCRTRADRREGVTPVARGAGTPTALGDALVDEAYRFYSTTGHSLLTLAEHYFERTPYRSVGGLAQAFSRQFKRRGWPVPPRRELAA